MRYALPMPPSLNRLYRSVGGRVLVSKEGRAYKELVAGLLMAKRARPLSGRVRLWIWLFPPDRRRRDLDNAQKALLDAMKGRLYQDDEQIDDLRIVRGEVRAGGGVEVEVEQLEGR